MATDHAKELIRRAVAETAVIEAFESLLNDMIMATTPPPPSDFFTESAALMKRESRVKTLRDILAVLRAMHEAAKSDNFYDVNQT